MADFRASTTVNVSEESLFGYLSRVENLPHYFARMTSATPGVGEEVHTSARMPDGTEVEGEAWFRADTDARRIEWGSEGANDYHGSLEVTGTPAGSRVELQVHTTRVADGDQGIHDSLDATLATVKRLTEDRSVPR